MANNNDAARHFFPSPSTETRRPIASPRDAGRAQRRLGRFARRCTALIACCMALAAQAADLSIYTEDAAAAFSQIERVAEDPAAACTGDFGLRVTPTYWHYQLLRLAAGRTDFRPYSAFSFRIRAEQGEVDPSIVLADQRWGTSVRVADYVDGGVVDANWREAVIPMDALASPEFALDSVFLIMFGPSPAPAPFYVDDIRLIDTARPHVLGWSTPSARVLTVRLDSLDIDALETAAFTVSSDTDPDFAAPVPVQAVGADRAAVDITEGGQGAVVESRLHLVLPRAMQPGQTYRVDLAELVGASGAGLAEPELPLSFTEDTVSSSIQVNQVGYLPAATKLGFVGNWLGDIGPMPV
ncbi:MAG: hypothetical protein LJE69_11940, partial [Thiohalocapsa sp.]|uniref:hypothetical protein n=1 Tax=Thiohalocapsa sp. TaxID=2497641 RepID=UPI0025E565D4